MGNRQNLALSTNKKSKKHKPDHLQKKSPATFTEKSLLGQDTLWVTSVMHRKCNLLKTRVVERSGFEPLKGNDLFLNQ
jgi:hypothetical protein